MEVFNREETRGKRKNLRKNQTDAERKIWEQLRDRRFMGLKFYRQYGIGYYIADFYCPKKKLVIELDGGQHFTEEGKDYDKEREDIFSSVGIKTIRFSNSEVLTQLEDVLNKIEEETRERPLSPPLCKRGGKEREEKK